MTDAPESRAAGLRPGSRAAVGPESRSHHVTRMARRGLVERTTCVADGRGAFIGVTPAGRAAIEQAARAASPPYADS